MNPENEKNITFEDNLTAEDIAAIKRSEKEIERGEVIELDEAIKLFRKRYPEAGL